MIGAYTLVLFLLLTLFKLDPTSLSATLGAALGFSIFFHLQNLVWEEDFPRKLIAFFGSAIGFFIARIVTLYFFLGEPVMEWGKEDWMSEAGYASIGGAIVIMALHFSQKIVNRKKEKEQ
jgi:hypothetical protein